MKDIITITTADRSCRYVSPAFETSLGYKVTDFHGKGFAELYHPDDLQMIKRVAFLSAVKDEDFLTF